MNPPTEPNHRRRAVVAEDEALIRMDLVEMLGENGWEVVGQAADGAAAVRLAAEHLPDVVLMDVKMPVLDGIAAAEQIAQAGTAPVVLLTAFSQRELVERASAVGVMGYVVKPFTAADVLPAVEIAVARHQQMLGLRSELADLGSRLAARKDIERAKGLLQERFSFDEAEAFRWMQKAAMDRRLSLADVAASILRELGGDS